ncbi:hypothetical protein Poli38472_011813 [Pythium oligandrum]|uniref:Crinkler (CRN) family protein n=1 Tax=Pythium oligandrum TaxID=41045 RepID=A0A8K1C852_PYTOL|nr:hypothetical protein Poli38472_011813 [Pythium oligandrum]|eukprot:TMW58225.1 hypothetical protein Poli38472_011813 [Pythium oligandrum]
MGEAQDLRNVEGLQSLQPFYFSPLRDVGLSQNDIKEEGGKIGPAQASMHAVVIVQRRPAVELDDVPASKLSTLGMMLKQFSGPVALPEQGDFLSLFKWNDGDIGTVKDIAAINSIVGFTGPSLYVHKEIICVLKNFLKVYAHNFKTGEETLQQFVLVGSPGTGKSCILALVCFYVAAKLGRTVVWHRRVRSKKKKQIVTYVFHEKKVYQLKDLTGEMYNQLYAVFQGDTCGPTNCWFCLDGVNQEQVERMNWTSTYDMLATSCQFDVNSEMGSFSRVCVVPYWKQGDLEDLASKLNDPPQCDVDSRYYVSGGSLREFLNPYAKENAEAAILQISSAQVAETLLSKVGSNSDIQVDRLRSEVFTISTTCTTT